MVIQRPMVSQRPTGLAVRMTEYQSGYETFVVDDDTGIGSILWRSDTTPLDTEPELLDDHFLGARLTAPLKKPWQDIYLNVQQKASPGSLHAIHAESLDSWSNVGPALTANTAYSLARPISFQGTQVCMGGGLPPCSNKIPVFHWEPQHEFRGLRHLIAFRRFGWPSDGFLAECALSRVVHEPTLYDTPKNQREIGWPLLLLAEYVGVNLDGIQITDAIQKIVELLWGTHGENYLTLNTNAGADHGYLPVCSWMHAVLTRALGRLVRRGWPDPRVAALYKAGIKGLDAMSRVDSFSWVKDWDPATGKTVGASTPWAGTSLWTACAYAESLAVVESNSEYRHDFLKGFMAKSAALNPADKNYDPASHALLTALVT